MATATPRPDPFSLAGKRALITGGGRGVGRTLALALASAGAEIAITAREVGSLATTIRLLGHLDSSAVPIAMDVTRIDSIRDGTAEAAEALGGLDILVNNAGVEQATAALEVEEDQWDRILDTNLRGAFFAAQAAARLMVEGAGGAILNICSLAAERGIPGSVPYGCSKAGLLGMTRALAAEWGRYFIRVNALLPGYVHTDMTEHFYLDREWRAAMLARTPISRLGHIENLSGAAVFLVSDAARFITGTGLPVDGGLLAAI